jgi:hypothetical protein
MAAKVYKIAKVYKDGITIEVQEGDVHRYLKSGFVLVSDPPAEAEKPADPPHDVPPVDKSDKRAERAAKAKAEKSAKLAADKLDDKAKQPSDPVEPAEKSNEEAEKPAEETKE